MSIDMFPDAAIEYLLGHDTGLKDLSTPEDQSESWKRGYDAGVAARFGRLV